VPRSAGRSPPLSRSHIDLLAVEARAVPSCGGGGQWISRRWDLGLRPGGWCLLERVPTGLPAQGDPKQQDGVGGDRRSLVQGADCSVSGVVDDIDLQAIGEGFADGRTDEEIDVLEQGGASDTEVLTHQVATDALL
jgi:hypothetical protein